MAEQIIREVVKTPRPDSKKRNKYEVSEKAKTNKSDTTSRPIKSKRIIRYEIVTHTNHITSNVEQEILRLTKLRGRSLAYIHNGLKYIVAFPTKLTHYCNHRPDNNHKLNQRTAQTTDTQFMAPVPEKYIQQEKIPPCIADTLEKNFNTAARRKQPRQDVK